MSYLRKLNITQSGNAVSCITINHLTVSVFINKKHPPEVFYKKSCSQKLHLSGLQLFKKRLKHRCFPVNIAKFLRAPVLKDMRTAASA